MGCGIIVLTLFKDIPGWFWCRFVAFADLLGDYGGFGFVETI
jgi:hypothetical protein